MVAISGSRQCANKGGYKARRWKRAEIIVPDNPGKQLHLILELTDNGTPNLKSYKRVILNVN